MLASATCQDSCCVITSARVRQWRVLTVVLKYSGMESSVGSGTLQSDTSFSLTVCTIKVGNIGGRRFESQHRFELM